MRKQQQSETTYIRRGQVVEKCRILKHLSARCTTYLLNGWLCFRFIVNVESPLFYCWIAWIFVSSWFRRM